jgi:aspartyl protease family protein
VNQIGWAAVTILAFALGWFLGQHLGGGAAPADRGTATSRAADGSGRDADAVAVASPAEPSLDDWGAALAYLDALVRTGRQGAAIAWRERLLERMREGDPQVRERRLAAFLTRNVHDPDAYLLQAAALADQGRVEEAMDSLFTLLAFADDPQVIEAARDALGQLVAAVAGPLERQGDIPALVRLFEALSLRDPGFDGHRLELARWQLASGAADAAARTLAETGTAGVSPQALEDLAVRIDLARVGLPVERTDQALHVTVRANGQAVRLLVDTGASSTVVSRRVARTAGADTLGERVRVSTAGGVVMADVYQLRELEVGVLRLTGVPVLVLDGPLPDGVDGLLGMDVLSRFPDPVGGAAALRPGAG